VSARGTANDDVAIHLVSIANGAATYPVLAHLYDLGAERGYRVVGLERPETTDIDFSDWD
jgi:hypothetical protein